MDIHRSPCPRKPTLTGEYFTVRRRILRDLFLGFRVDRARSGGIFRRPVAPRLLRPMPRWRVMRSRWFGSIARERSAREPDGSQHMKSKRVRWMAIAAGAGLVLALNAAAVVRGQGPAIRDTDDGIKYDR